MWHPLIADIAPDGPDAWLAHAPDHFPDGTANRGKPAVRTQRVEYITLDDEDDNVIVIRLSFPLLPRSNEQTLTIRLAPGGAGTRVTVDVVWRPHTPRRRSPLAWVLRPLTGFAVRMHARTLAEAIAGSFR